MYLSHRIRLYPNEAAESYFRRACGTQRFAYNWAREFSRWVWKTTGKTTSAYELSKYINAVKKEQFPWMYEVTKWAVQKGVYNLRDALQNFFEGRAKYPKKKKKGKCRDTFYIGIDNLKVSGKYLRLPNVKGAVKMAQEIRFPGKINSVTISREADEWYASFQVELPFDYQYPHRCETQTVGGMDLGVKALATLDDGKTFDNPKQTKKAVRKLRKAHKRVSRKVLGSKNRKKAVVKLAKQYQYERRVRTNAIHNLTAWLVKNYRLLGIEDLNVKGMVKNRKLAKALQHKAFGEVKRQLCYKSALAGSTVVQADTFFPSSKTCSVCFHVVDSLPLDIREWACPACGIQHDRDVNAARNLKRVAVRYTETKNACGETVRPGVHKDNWQDSAKQEPV